MKKIYLYTITTLLLCIGAAQAQNPLGFPYEREWATYLPTTNNGLWSLYTKNDGSVLLTTIFDDVSPGNDNLDDLITPDAYQPLKTNDFSMFLGVTDSKGKGEFKYGTYVNYGTIAIDKRDNFYLSGATLAQTNIATPGAYQQHLKGNEKISDGAITLPDGSIVPPPIPLRDGFIIKFNAQNKQPEWGTYFNGDDGGTTIEIFGFDENSLYFIGYTTSTSGIATPGAAFPNPMTGSKNESPRLLGRMTTDGKLLWCTYIHPLIGKTRYDGLTHGSMGVGLDSQSNVYYTSDNAIYKLDKDGNFIKEYPDVFEEGGEFFITPNDKMYILGLALKDSPVLSTPGTYKVTKNAEYELYLSSYNLDMQKQWGTYIAETERTNPVWWTLLPLDRWGNPILMTTTNKNGLASADAYQTTVQGKDDHLILSLNQDGQFNWATYYGGQREEYYHGQVGYHLGNENANDVLYFNGVTESPTLIATEDSAYPKKTNPVGASIGYLAKFVPLVTASVDKPEESDFVLWPNPATELLNLRSNTVLTEQSMLTVYDFKGKKVLAVKGDPANVQVINVSSLAQGSYILQVEDADNGINHSVKFVKK